MEILSLFNAKQLLIDIIEKKSYDFPTSYNFFGSEKWRTLWGFEALPQSHNYFYILYPKSNKKDIFETVVFRNKRCCEVCFGLPEMIKKSLKPELHPRESNQIFHIFIICHGPYRRRAYKNLKHTETTNVFDHSNIYDRWSALL